MCNMWEDVWLVYDTNILSNETQEHKTDDKTQFVFAVLLNERFYYKH